MPLHKPKIHLYLPTFNNNTFNNNTFNNNTINNNTINTTNFNTTTFNTATFNTTSFNTTTFNTITFSISVSHNICLESNIISSNATSSVQQIFWSLGLCGEDLEDCIASTRVHCIKSSIRRPRDLTSHCYWTSMMPAAISMPPASADPLPNTFKIEGSSDDVKSGTLKPVQATSLTKSEDDESPLFSIFENLPLELRSIVWLSSFLPRTIKLATTFRSKTFVLSSDIAQARINTSYTVPPSLHVHKESRALALKFYTKAFLNHPKLNPMYVNYDRDSLQVDARLLESSFVGQAGHAIQVNTLDNIRHLVLTTGYLTNNGLEKLLARFFPSLETLCLSSRTSWGGVRDHKREKLLKQYFDAVRPGKVAGEVSRAAIYIEFMTEDEMAKKAAV
ncbi:uncharacterized protein L3040_000933 [Drepanopeziza brunnea f. sp. 'multigermtubi']|nr:hypothetical protein L3040_000933 [Drepanopeziza brunnea f. sp. 'multigermtubi']